MHSKGDTADIEKAEERMIRNLQRALEKADREAKRTRLNEEGDENKDFTTNTAPTATSTASSSSSPTTQSAAGPSQPGFKRLGSHMDARPEKTTKMTLPTGTRRVGGEDLQPQGNQKAMRETTSSKRGRKYNQYDEECEQP